MRAVQLAAKEGLLGLPAWATGSLGRREAPHNCQLDSQIALTTNIETERETERERERQREE